MHVHNAYNPGDTTRGEAASAAGTAAAKRCGSRGSAAWLRTRSGGVMRTQRRRLHSRRDGSPQGLASSACACPRTGIPPPHCPRCFFFFCSPLAGICGHCVQSACLQSSRAGWPMRGIFAGLACVLVSVFGSILPFAYENNDSASVAMMQIRHADDLDFSPRTEPVSSMYHPHHIAAIPVPNHDAPHPL